MSASKQQTPKHGSGHQHPAELRERAVRMVQETMMVPRPGVSTRFLQCPPVLVSPMGRVLSCPPVSGGFRKCVTLW